MLLKKYSSPNFDERPRGAAIDTIVIHSTHLSFKDSLARLCDPIARVSCHYLLDRNGEAYQLVKDKYRAWHAGKSYWRGQDGLNANSIGIELVDSNAQGIRLKSFSVKQMQVLVKLLGTLIKKYKIQNRNIVAHSDIAPDRKDDPGEYFDWKAVFLCGIGVYHALKITKAMRKPFITRRSSGSEIKKLQKLFKAYGYKIKMTGKFDKQTLEVLVAFKRHFNPRSLKQKCCTAGDYAILQEICNCG